MNKIKQAKQFATKAHVGQLRRYTGEKYIKHLERVAMRTAMVALLTNESNGLGLSQEADNMIVAAFLHDVLEDTDITIGAIEAAFGADVAKMVAALTNASKGSALSREARKKMDRDHLANATKAVKIIKLIDRIDNLNDMAGATADFRRLYSKESLLLAEVIGDADAELKTEMIKIASQFKN